LEVPDFYFQPVLQTFYNVLWQHQQQNVLWQHQQQNVLWQHPQHNML